MGSCGAIDDRYGIVWISKIGLKVRIDTARPGGEERDETWIRPSVEERREMVVVQRSEPKLAGKRGLDCPDDTLQPIGSELAGVAQIRWT